MAFSISSCCLKPSCLPSPPPPPPPPLSHSPLTKTTLTPRSASKEVSWQSRCMATAACIIIGSSTACFAAAGSAVFAGGDDLKVMEVSEGKVVRWSDRRKCPPWHVNSLENIVPENLPRPPTGPRSDGLVDHKNAPKVGEFSIQYKSSCYSL